MGDPSCFLLPEHENVHPSHAKNDPDEQYTIAQIKPNRTKKVWLILAI